MISMCDLLNDERFGARYSTSKSTPSLHSSIDMIGPISFSSSMTSFLVEYSVFKRLKPTITLT